MSHVKTPKNPSDNGNALIKREDEVEFKVIVAIDFGTHGTGLGYAMVPKDDEKKQKTYTEQDWGGTRKNIHHKNKTDILLAYDGKFLKFGDSALEEYLNQGDDNGSDSNSDSDEEDEKQPKHMLFESFKMALYEKKQDGQQGDIRAQIACVDGRLYSTQTVFIHALKYMKKIIFQTFKNKKIVLPNGIDDIQWILTVPAIWSDRAKHKMDYWAQRAGLINKNIYNHLRIVYEPDCASISCQYEAADQDQKSNDNSSFGVGERYVLIDAGGGTVDIAWHQVKAEYNMEEIHHPTGGPWGSDYIDEHFEELLQEIFTEDAIDAFKQSNTANYTKIKNNFRKSKMSFYSLKTQKFHQVKLSSEFINFIATFNAEQMGIEVDDEEEEFNKIIETATPFGIPMGCLKMDTEFLLMSSKIWIECLFDKVINPMITHVQKMIPIVNQTEDKKKQIKNIRYLCIAGGLASSKYFQSRIYDTFGMKSQYKLSIRIPRIPILSVIDGALKLGLNPNYISTRRLKYTYGIAVDRTEKNVSVHELPHGYLQETENGRLKNVYVHPNTGERVVRNLFSKWVSKNDAIDIGQAFEKGYRRFHKNEKSTKLSIYSSSNDKPYVVEGKPLASVIIPFPAEYTELAFTVQFNFGDTKITAKVLYKDSKAKNEEHTLWDKLELKYEFESTADN